MHTLSSSGFSGMRSSVFRSVGLPIGALLLLTVGATKDDYACHFPDDPQQPISCLVSAVKESIVFDRSNYQGPYYYSEHTMTTDEDGIKRYSSVTCKVARVRREKRKFFESVGSCDMEWLRDAGLVAYTAGSNGYMVDMPRGGGVAIRHFKKLTVKEMRELRLPRRGNRGDLVATYVNDEPERLKAHVLLGPRFLFSQKRKVCVKFYRVESLGNDDESGNDDGKAFFFKHGSTHRPGEYAVFVTIFDKVYLLFDTPDRNNTEPDLGTAAEHTSLWDPPPRYRTVSESCISVAARIHVNVRSFRVSYEEVVQGIDFEASL